MGNNESSEFVLRAIKQNRMVIIYRGLEPETCLKASQVLYDAGVRLFEVTMNSEATEEAIALLSKELESDALIGAGTVLSTDEVISANKAGAQYIISPNTNIDVIKRTKDLGMVSVPGAMTPSEVELASRSGGDIIKVFPVNVLGPAYIRQLKGPLDRVELLACGGVQLEMVNELFRAGCSAMGVGVQLLGKNLIDNEDWTGLHERAGEFIRASIVKES